MACAGREACARLAIALGAAALLVLAGWSSQADVVDHGTLTTTGGTVEVWRDASSSELALQLRGSDSWTLLRRRTRFDFVDGRVSGVTVHVGSSDPWRSLATRYGVTPERAAAALAAGDRVQRPALMNTPNLEATARAYLFAIDYGTNVEGLRMAARFPVPAPGSTLAGLRLAKASLTQRRGPGRLRDGGFVASLFYSADPEHLGTGERQIAVAAALTGSAADSYKRFYTTSRSRLTGEGYDARVTPDGAAIVRYRGIYVLVVPSWAMPMGQLRSVVRAVARS